MAAIQAPVSGRRERQGAEEAVCSSHVSLESPAAHLPREAGRRGRCGELREAHLSALLGSQKDSLLQGREDRGHSQRHDWQSECLANFPVPS